MLWNSEDLGMSLRYKAAEAQAQSLGIDVQSYGVTAPNGFDAAFAAHGEPPARTAILMVSDVLTTFEPQAGDRLCGRA